MRKRLLLSVLLLTLLLTAALPASAVDYTDIWYLAAESGWGVNVVQSDKFMFATFFIYGSDKKPLWYTADLTQDQSGNFNGPLYVTTGSFYGAPWNTQDLSLAQVGTASFQPTSPSTAKLVYSVTTPSALAANVTKTIQRQTLTAINLAGAYFGGQTGTYSTCTSAASNGSYSDAFNLTVTQSSASNVTFQFAYASGLSCTLTGTLAQNGKLYTTPSAAYNCSDGVNTTATVSEIKATSLGIEGRLAASSVIGGCREDATFAATLQ